MIGDSTIAGAVATAKLAIRKVQDGEVPTTGGGVIIARTGSMEGAPAIPGLFGTSYKLSDIGSMGMKKYAAGELGDALIMVAVLQLKP